MKKKLTKKERALWFEVKIPVCDYQVVNVQAVDRTEALKKANLSMAVNHVEPNPTFSRRVRVRKILVPK